MKKLIVTCDICGKVFDFENQKSKCIKLQCGDIEKHIFLRDGDSPSSMDICDDCLNELSAVMSDMQNANK